VTRPSSREPTTGNAERDPEIVALDDDRADDLLSALSSATARTILERLHESPAPPSEIAESVDSTVQNVHYHLNRLEAADAVEAVDTVYSEKGREMRVYAPTAEPLVFVTGDDADGVVDLLSDLLGGVTLLALASVAVQELVRRLFYPGGPTPIREEGVSYALPPMENVAPPVGAYVFVAGLALLLAWGAWRYRRL
jgi:DNA-binding transcriptional ArsR family regulator